MVWEEFHESKNDDRNRNKKRRRPLSEHDGEQPWWYIIPTDTREMKNESL